jgi:hypothetical protein
MDKIIEDYIRALIDTLTKHKEKRAISLGVFLLCLAGLNDSLKEMTDNRELIDRFDDIIETIMNNNVDGSEQIYEMIVRIWQKYSPNQ